MRSIIIIITIILMMVGNGESAPGDIIYQCDFSGGNPTDPKSVVAACKDTTVYRPTVFNAGTQHTSSVPKTGGWNNGPYLRVQHSNATTFDCGDPMFGATPSALQIGLTSWTVTYYEKFESWPIATPNIKSSRIYHSNSEGYYGALIGAHMNYSGRSMYMSPWGTADVTVQTDIINQGIIAGSRYGSTDLTGRTITCNGAPAYGDPCVNKTNLGKYKFPGPRSDIISFAWTTNNGVTNGYGTTWHKLRIYTKLPSTDTANDGAITLWIDEKLAFTATNVTSSTAIMNALGYPAAGGAKLTGIKFYPSDDAQQPFVHAYDDIVIYEGYKPPGLSDPTGLKIITTP